MAPSEPPSVLQVPVLDIGALIAAKDDTEVRATLTEDDPILKHTIAELRKAAAEWGFFYIENHGVSEQQIEELRAASRAFFALPKNVKNQVRRQETNSRGYFDNELTKNKLDWKEVFDFTGPQEDGPPDDKVFKRLRDNQNQWLSEDDLPGFHKTVTDYYAAVEHIAHRLIQVFAVALGEDVEFFDQFFYRQGTDGASRVSGNTATVRLNHYPPSPEPEKTMGVYHHTDSGVLTVLLQDDDVASLQVFHRGTQQWLNVPPKKNTFVINIGDMVQVWSNDKFVAPLHRVVSTAAASRYSTPFFYSPSYDAVVSPIVINKDEEPHYRPIRYGDFTLERTKGNFADLGEEIQIVHFRIEP